MYSREWHEQQRRTQEQEQQNAAVVAEKSREVNDVNFPELVSSFDAAPPPSSGKGGWAQRGSDLARAWSDAERHQQEMDTMRRHAEEERDFRDRMFERSVMPLPMRSATSGAFNRADYDDTFDYRVSREEESTSSHGAGAGAPAEEESWTTVDNAKKRRTVNRSGMWHHVAEFEEPPAHDSVWGGGGKSGGGEEDESVW